MPPLTRILPMLCAVFLAACGPSAIGPEPGEDGGAPRADARPGSSADARPEPTSDPCNGVPTTGVCRGPGTIEMCVQPTGAGTPKLETVACQSGESCQMVDGAATCVLTAVCVDGQTECSGTSSLRRCVSGAWVSESCPSGCVSSPLGDSCASSGGLITISGSVTYETRSPNTGKTDWGPLWNAPAQGFLISSVRQTSVGWTYYDTQVTTAVA